MEIGQCEVRGGFVEFGTIHTGTIDVIATGPLGFEFFDLGFEPLRDEFPLPSHAFIHYI